MPRPRCCRRLSGAPACRTFKPTGVPASSLEEVALALDEYEAIRLADFEGLYQEEAARRMGVSRQTFGRTIEAARGKVARALVQGLLLRIEAPEAEAEPFPAMRALACAECAHHWDEPTPTGRPGACPACGCADVHRRRPGPAAAKPRGANPNLHWRTPMLKIAIPTRAGIVDGHFGHCESFTIFSLDENKSVAAQESFTPPPACGCKSNLIPTLSEMGVSLLIAGNMGEGAVVRLGQAGITVIRGASGPVQDALEAWRNGALADTELVCQEHGADHECSHGLKSL